MISRLVAVPRHQKLPSSLRRCRDRRKNPTGAAIHEVKGLRSMIKRRRPLLCFQQDSLCVMQVVKSVYFCDVYCIWVEKRVELPLMARHVKGIGARLSICNQTVSQARCRFCF